MNEVTVNEIFTQTITKVDSTFNVSGIGDNWYQRRKVQNDFRKIIDDLGEKSAQSQNLLKPITTTENLFKTPEYILYLLKDSERNGGSGEIIGMLKIGKKHLYLFDQEAKAHEVDSFCVLDFFVVEELQRKGYGKQLFDHMLKDLNLHAYELAIDGPSTKFEYFLKGKYGIESLIKQSNNFSIPPQFFQNIKEISANCSIKQRKPKSPVGAGRFTANKRPSTIGSIICGEQSGAEAMSNMSEPSDDENDKEEPQAAVAEPEVLYDTLPENLIALAMECIGINEPERPSVLEVGPVAESAAISGDSGGGTDGDSEGDTDGACDLQLTERGYVDLKYFHNRLW